jgi:protein-tyrosine phosphatase
MMPLLEVAPSYLDASVQAIKQEFGGMDRYLTEVLEIDVDVLRDHYLES